MRARARERSGHVPVPGRQAQTAGGALRKGHWREGSLEPTHRHLALPTPRGGMQRLLSQNEDGQEIRATLRDTLAPMLSERIVALAPTLPVCL